MSVSARGRSAAWAAAAAVALLAWTPAAGAQVLLPGVDPGPIPSPLSGDFEPFEGKAAKADPFEFPATPQHPFMAPNGLSNIHVDPYQTDTNAIRGPLGETTTDSIFFAHECASITFDSQGRLVTICVGLERPILALLDPGTLVPLATYSGVPGGYRHCRRAQPYPRRSNTEAALRRLFRRSCRGILQDNQGASLGCGVRAL
jgi:hypothetical protein